MPEHETTMQCIYRSVRVRIQVCNSRWWIISLARAGEAKGGDKAVPGGAAVRAMRAAPGN